MRVATFNILHGRSLVDERVDVDRFAEAVRGLGADVLGLQEVDRHLPRSAFADLTKVAAEAMDAVDYRFVPSLAGSPESAWTAVGGVDDPGVPAYGIALLSRYPVRSWQVVRLARSSARLSRRSTGKRWRLLGDEPRVAVAARIDTPLGEITVANTHLSFLRWRGRRQLRTLMRALDGVDPLLLLGDLNMPLARVRALTRLTPLVEEATFPARAPREQIDHVLARGEAGRVVDAGAHHLPLSDHRALTVDLG